MKKTGNLSREELSRLAKRLGKKKTTTKKKATGATRPSVRVNGGAAPRTAQSAIRRVDRSRPDGSTRELPLSFSQERLWFLDRMEPGRSWYNLAVAVRLSGRLDVPALAHSLATIGRRHEGLRTSFRQADGAKPVQIVAPAGTVRTELPLVDLSALPDAVRDRVAHRLGEAEGARPFDLSRAPLIRYLLLRLDRVEDTAGDKTKGASDHMLMATMHHIVSDGWSMGVFLRELAALYGAFTEGLPSPLPELGIQYPDFAVWQRQWLSGETLDRRIEHWRRTLGGAPELLELPTDRMRPPVQTQRGGQVPVSIPAAEVGALRELVRSGGATLFMALLALFDILLHRLSGADDLVVGTPVAGRSRQEIEGLIGFFVNTLPLRVQMTGDESFRELLDRVRGDTLDAFEHQDVPFEKLVERLDVRRDPSRSPIFQVMMALQNAPMGRHELPGVSFEPVPMDGGTAKFDLTLMFVERPDGSLGGSFEYNRDLFDPSTARRMVARLRTLLRSALEDPEAAIGRLPLLAAAERHQVLTEWNDTLSRKGAQIGVEHGVDADWEPVHRRVARLAAEAPDAVAVVDGDRAVTAGALVGRARRLATRLRQRGARPGTVVALCFERSVELVTAALATLEAGAAYLPIDPSYPEERRGYMLEDSGAAILVTPDDLAADRMDGEGDGPRAERAADAKSPDPAEAAYVIYTSGSTGLPKGTVLAHRGLANLVGWHRDAHGLGRDDRTAMVAGPGFDASVWETWGSLTAGAPLVIADRDIVLSPERLVDWLAAHRVTVCFAPTPLAEAILEQTGARSSAASPALRALLTGGDALHRRPEPGSTFDLVNHYGPTESTVVATSSLVPPAGGPANQAPPPIGRPIANLRTYVLDRSMEAVPIGVPGELHVSGVGLSRGYLGRPALTAERFVPDPFAAVPGARAYRTGDLVRLRPDGELDFLGRIDHQVKVRGVRMELGEIESALGELAGVHQAVVLALPSGPGGDSADRQLVAFLVAELHGADEETESLDVETLRTALAKRLPEAMVPTGWVTLDELPLLASGKVDRRALAADADPRDWQHGTDGTEHVPPRTAVEAEIAAVWRELLAPEEEDRAALRIGVHDDFFRLGGHSLMVTRLVSHLRERLGVDLPVRTVFEAPTLERLAAAVETAAWADQPQLLRTARDRPDGPDGPERELPLSFSQERLWFLDRLEPGRAWYNLPVAVRLVGRLDVPAMARSLATIARRHEALRTSFHEGDGGAPVQVIEPVTSARPALQVVDLSALPPAARDRATRARSEAEALRPFDLSRPPLVRSLLLRLNGAGPEEAGAGEAGPGSQGSEHVLLVTMHHIVSDGWSMEVFLRELAALYGAFTEGRPSPLPELPIQYPDFAAWQRLWLSGETLNRRLDHWAERLAGAPELLELPTDRPRPPVQTERGGLVYLEIPAADAGALHELAQDDGATLFMALLALFDTLLHRLSGADDLVVGTPVAGRSRREVEGLIGFFVNTLPLRARVTGGESFRALLERVRADTIDAFEHQDVPFEKLVERLDVRRDPSHSPVFQALLTLQNAPMGRHELPGVAFEPVPTEGGTAKFDLTLAFVERPNGDLGCSLEFNRDLFDPSTARRMVGGLRTLLTGVLADPETPISRLPLLSAAERQQLVEWNDTARPAHPATISSLFAIQAERTPDAVAVVAGDQALTYGGLLDRAAGLARHLEALGAGPEALLGVVAERSTELMVGLLGTLLSGAAYVPLDPTYPVERLRFMAADAGLEVLLVQQGFEQLAASLRSTDRADGAERTEALPIVPLTPDRTIGTIRAAGSKGSERPVAGRLAYTIYTSGSTGRPKGAMNSHAGPVNRLLWMIEHYRIDAGERFLQKTPFGFDVSVWELFVPLVCGARLEMARPGGHRDPAYLAALIAERGITTAHAVPSMLRELLEVPGVEACAASLRRVVASGEALTPDLVARFYDRLGTGSGDGPQLLDLYGPTETAIEVTHWRCPVPDPYATTEPMEPIPIGRPVDNASVQVVDANLSAVPTGVAGELLLGGVPVGRGYLGRPGLTADRFVPDPFSEIPGARVYRSGDLARWRPDGVIEFLGRIDHQVKIHGVRMELGEIESALDELDGVRQAVVLALPSGLSRPEADASSDLQLVAFVLPEAAADAADPPDDGVLRAALARRLPEAMVPAGFVIVTSLPLLPSGKVDRKALAASADPRDWRLGSTTEHVPPRTVVETEIAAVWRELLAQDEGDRAALRIGVHDDFFRLGGHSLLVTRLVAQLRERLGAELPVRTVFEAPTLGALAAAVEAAPRATAPPLRRIDRDRPETDLPLSFSQERLWFLDRMEPGRAWYNLPAAVRLSGRLDVPAMARSLATIARRHEALRTSFREGDGGAPVQVIEPAASAQPALPVVDLSALPPAARDRAARARSEAEALRPFDLSRPPLVRSLLLRLNGADPEKTGSRETGPGARRSEHVLVVTMHHIVSDGWSTGVFLRELAALYSAFTAGRPSPLPELPIQYPDFAVWQRLWLSGETLNRRLEHWSERLSGAPELLELPTDRPRPPVQTQRGAVVPLGVSATEAGALRDLALSDGATLFMALLALFDILLHRLSGTDDLVVGTPVAGRSHREVEGLIGFFVNTLPLRTRLTGEKSFRALLRGVRDDTLDAFEHQDVPFEKLVERLDIRRDPSRSPVFQVVLALQNAPMGRHELPGVSFESLPIAGRTAKFDLTLVFVERPDGGLAGTLESNRDLFDPTTAQRMVRRLGTLLTGALADPDAAIGRLPLLAAGERQQVLTEWNDTLTQMDADTGAATGSGPGADWEPVHHRVARLAAEAPDAVAVVDGDRMVTAGALAGRARRLAARLGQRGVRPGAIVALCFERSAELVTAALATLEAGAAYLPIDPSYPEERRSFMLEDSGAAVLLTPNDLDDDLDGDLTGDLDHPLDGGETGERIGDEAAYVIYTSGSTGRPKGTVLAHRGLANLAGWHRTAYALGRDDRTGMVAGPGFDASVWETWSSLTAGAPLVIADRDTALSAERLAAWLVARRVSVCFLPTPLAEAVLEEPGALSPTDPPALRALLTGGDALHRRPEPDRTFSLINHYGPTESTVVATCSPVPPVAPTAEGTRQGAQGSLAPPPIGRPIANLRTFVLDRSLEPVPIGVPGELHVAGIGLSRGYLDRPALTAERFVPDPFAGADGGVGGARLYRTGDLVRLRTDGELDFLGRIDHQVQVRGFRIELGEIEERLAADPRVARAVVMARGEPPAGLRLDGYVVPAARGELSAKERADLVDVLRTELAGDLPEYMVPSTFTVLDALPLTANGKVDRRALPDPAAAGILEAGGERPFEPPASATEEAIAALWRELLGAERVGRHDDFFQLGGHSLLATRLVSRMRRELGVELPLKRLFEAPTVAGLAKRIERIDSLAAGEDGAGGGGAAVTEAAPPIRPRERPEAIPLSFAQERLWFLDRFDPGSSAYNIPAAFRLRGTLDLPTLTAALSEIVRRHEALRTTFAGNADGAHQVIHPPFRLEPPVIDLQDGSHPDALEVEALARREAERPFDLEAGPLVRATLLRLAPDEHVFLLTLHHIVSDGWSAGLFVGELAALYQALDRALDRVQGQSAGTGGTDVHGVLPPLPIQYADFALWQREWLAGDELERQLAYWRGRFAGAPEVLELPTDRPRPSVITPQGRRHPVTVDAELTEGLRRLARAEGTTLFAVLLAAFDALLYRVSGQDDLVVGSPVANRTREEVEGLIGMFVNTLALRVGVEGDPSFRALLGRVHQASTEAYAHQDLPFEKLVGELQPERSRSHTPIFQVMLSLHDAGMTRFELPGLELEPLEVRGATAKFDLTLALTETPEGLRGILGYRQALFDATTVERLGERLDAMLRAVVADPERSVRSLPLLSSAEAHQVVVAFNDTPAIPAEERPIHRLVAARAEAAPDAVALVLGDDRLTYGALARRARRLAHRLRTLGAGPGRRVAVCLERSFDQIVAVVAALEAGAAYVPLDLGFPGERLAFMVADSGPVALVTRSEHRALFDSLAEDERPREVLLDRSEELEPNALDGEDAGPDDGAYVIYTSGSTGRPKGVLVTHRSLAERLSAIRELFAFGPDDTQLQFASLSFDLSCDEVFLTLTTGATLVIEPRPAALRPLDLMDECARRRATKLSLTSSHWHQIVDELAAADRTVPGSLRTLCTGAEAPSAEKFAELARRAPGARLYNFYGPTEATISGTRLRLPKDPETIAGLGRVPIGRPFRGVRVYLADPALCPVPIGVAGEILLGGSGVAVGYLGRPALTAERFVPDAWSRTPGARLYRTGDLARHRFDGAIEFLGRADTQVKVRGFRIELGEVEEALRELPEVREAAVMVRSDTGDERLVAYLVPEPGTAPATLTVSALRAALGERLPEFMVPSAFVSLDEMPSTPTGKLDKKALPAPDSARPDLAGAYIPPKTALERFLAEAWQDVLGVDRAGLDDSFFDLGGNSIQGATLINRLEETLGQHVYVTALFDTRNLGELATYLAVQYDERVSELFGEDSLPPEALDAMKRRRESTRRVDAERLDALRSLVEPLAPFPREGAPKNPRAVFVLSPPRSGSTLLRVMLAGHPKLFAPPELELLPFNTLGDRKRAFSDRYSFWLEGVLRAVMELRGCDADEARAMMEERERREQPVRDFYREMQGWIGERILVDKTPSYALDPAILERAEEDFDEPLYLHLLRHPYGGILSFEEARLEQLFFRYDHDFERRELAELIWTASHLNIVSFLEEVPAERQLRVHFEDMVSDPEPVMRGVASFLGLDYQPAMIEPYQERQRRMTDGIHEQAKMLGDVKFHSHKKIDSSAAERWRAVYTEDFLGDVTRELAIDLGYRELEESRPAAAQARELGESGQPRHELPPSLTALRPGDEDTPALFMVHAVFGDTYFFRYLAAALAPGRPVYGLRALGMEAGEEPLRSIEAMAQRYLASIRAVQPEGPYHLVGSSMGGVIAYEIARRLTAAGHEVALLGFLDTGAPGEAPTPDDGDEGRLFEIEALHHLLGGADPETVARLEGMDSRDQRLASILSTAQAAGALPASFDLDRLRRLMDVVNANGRAMLDYRPQPYAGEILHVRAAATAGRMERPETSGWSALAGDVTVEIVPGDHMSIHFPPHAERLAHTLEQRLDRRLDHRRPQEAATSTERTP